MADPTAHRTALIAEGSTITLRAAATEILSVADDLIGKRRGDPAGHQFLHMDRWRFERLRAALAADRSREQAEAAADVVLRELAQCVRTVLGRDRTGMLADELNSDHDGPLAAFAACLATVADDELPAEGDA